MAGTGSAADESHPPPTSPPLTPTLSLPRLDRPKAIIRALTSLRRGDVRRKMHRLAAPSKTYSIMPVKKTFAGEGGWEGGRGGWVGGWGCRGGGGNVMREIGKKTTERRMFKKKHCLLRLSVVVVFYLP